MRGPVGPSGRCGACTGPCPSGTARRTNAPFGTHRRSHRPCPTAPERRVHAAPQRPAESTRARPGRPPSETSHSPNMPPAPLDHQLLEPLRGARLFPEPGTAVLAVSGGPDSLALLDLFHAIAHELSPPPLVAPPGHC